MIQESLKRLAWAKARALGVDVAVVDFPSFVHVIPMAEAVQAKEGTLAFVATPLEALEHAGHYGFIEACCISARAIAKLYATPQAIWKLSAANTDHGGMYLNCAASFDVKRFDSHALHMEAVDVD